MPNRTICSVLEEMRKLHETRNFASLLGLIEEAQLMANRMESALYDLKDLRRVQKEVKELNQEIQKLEDKKKNLENS